MTHSKLLAAMECPDFYPERPEKVEAFQTHISYIFMVGGYVYKVKKAVDFEFLDFTTLEKRRHFCLEELRLNRRLAAHAYLDVVEISENTDGSIVLGTGDRVIDYAVRMRRLPEERMLKKLMAADDFEPAVMDALAAKLADFHRQADTGGAIDAMGTPETIRRNHDENFAETKKYIDMTIAEAQYRFIRTYIYRFLEEKELFLAERVLGHRIRDGHGDLHLDHIVVEDEITIFDCIEFNERFRYGDVAAEVAFLAMDLDFNGYCSYADRFVDAYARYSGDMGVPVLLNFYRCYYAFVRGKVASFCLDDPEIAPEAHEAVKKLAGRYFDLAYTYAARLERPTLILMAGLTGTGKSAIAAGMAPRLGARIIQTDVLRKELLGIAPTEHHHAAFGAGIYSADISRRTYAAAREAAREHLRAGRSVIIDASCKSREEREKVLQMARDVGADYFVVACVCPNDIVKKRLEGRMSLPQESSDGRWNIYLAQKQDFDPLTDIPDQRLIVVNTAEPINCCLQQILEATSCR